MKPARFDFTTTRGSAGPTQGLIFRLKTHDSSGTIVNIPFDDVRLSISVKGTRIYLASINDSESELTVSDSGEAEIQWSPRNASTRLIPLGQKAYYEVEVRFDGDECIYLCGMITGTGGVNDDL